MTDYERGYAAYFAELTDDISESAEWHEGYEAARDEPDLSDGMYDD